MNEAKLIDSIRKHEGLKLRAYTDSVGVWSAGYGRNLQAMTISQHVADEWLEEDVYAALLEAKKFPEWAFLDTDARQNAFSEICFNIGPNRLAGFKNMLAAIRKQDWTVAAMEALNSKWATQVGQRALTLIAMLQTGEFPT